MLATIMQNTLEKEKHGSEKDFETNQCRTSCPLQTTERSKETGSCKQWSECKHS
jgi:hypothetical protein